MFDRYFKVLYYSISNNMKIRNRVKLQKKKKFEQKRFSYQKFEKYRVEGLRYFI